MTLTSSFLYLSSIDAVFSAIFISSDILSVANAFDPLQ